MDMKEELKILGVTIAKDLSWDSHTTKLMGGLRHRFRGFHRACRWLSVDTRKLLYNSTIASRLNYADIVWDNCKQDSVNKLQTIQNRCMRRILNKLPGASSAPLLNELGWLTLQEKRKLHRCVMLHGLMQGKGPRALCAELDKWKNRGPKNTRAKTSECLSLPSHRTKYVAKSFLYVTVKFWNQLPTNIRQIKNRTTFKESLHKYLLNNRLNDHRS